jgi:hypothetical protein
MLWQLFRCSLRELRCVLTIMLHAALRTGCRGLGFGWLVGLDARRALAGGCGFEPKGRGAGPF